MLKVLLYLKNKRPKNGAKFFTSSENPGLYGVAVLNKEKNYKNRRKAKKMFRI